jgi:adenylate kinase
VFIAERFSIPKISTGDIFRANVSGGTELGKLAKEYMDAGDLVPDEVTIAMVRDRLGEPDAAAGFLLDGFPRNVAQAYELDSVLNDLGSSLDVVLELEVDNDEVVKRLSGRRTCRKCGHIVHVDYDATTVDGVCDKCGGELFQRDDDKAETVRHRLDVYAEQTAPLIQFYAKRGQLVVVDALGTVEDVTERATAALAEAAAS